MDTKFLKKAGSTIKKVSPQIMTGLGIAGFIAAGVHAVKVTPKAIELLDNEKKALGRKLTTKETIGCTWKLYLPAVTESLLSAGLLIASNVVSTKRTAAIASAYTIAAKSAKIYAEKVVETVGEKKEEMISQKAKEEILKEKGPVDDNQVIVTNSGECLFYDEVSGRYFTSSINKVEAARNKLNDQLINEMYCSLNEFYWEIGLKGIDLGNNVGWNIDQGIVEINKRPVITENMDGVQMPVIYISYNVEPRYDYGKLM